MEQSYTVESVEAIETYRLYKNTLAKYRLTLDTGELVYLSRGVEKIAPQVGEVILGTIIPGELDKETILKVSRNKKINPTTTALAEVQSEVEALRREVAELKHMILGRTPKPVSKPKARKKVAA